MSDRTEGLAARLERTRERIRAAAGRAGRDPDSVEILPVTKGHPASLIRELAEGGVGRIGESRVQEAEEKRAVLGGSLGLRWHMIGHLQRNKAGRAVRLFDALESVDSLRLARRLSRELEEAERDALPVLVQVNTSGEETKGGFSAEELRARLHEVCRLDGLRVEGLMTMAPLTSDEEVVRGTFRRARELFEEWGGRVEGFEPRVLSMGMSNDFEIAVEEGSTRVRLGTVLFGERPDR